MPTLEQSADCVVQHDERLQAALRGEVVLLLLPGGSALIATQVGILVGWSFLTAPVVSSAIVVGNPATSATALGMYAASALLVSVVPGALIVGGWTAAHRLCRVECRLLLAIGAVALVASFVIEASATLAPSLVAVLLLMAAERLASSPSYALAAAFFRARRRRRIELATWPDGPSSLS